MEPIREVGKNLPPSPKATADYRKEGRQGEADGYQKGINLLGSFKYQELHMMCAFMWGTSPGKSNVRSWADLERS